MVLVEPPSCQIGTNFMTGGSTNTMVKFCCAVRPPCGANEPPPAEAFLCFDTDFTPYIRRLRQLVVLLRHKVVQLRHKSHFFVQLDLFPTQNTGWSLISGAVVLNK